MEIAHKQAYVCGVYTPEIVSIKASRQMKEINAKEEELSMRLGLGLPALGEGWLMVFLGCFVSLCFNRQQEETLVLLSLELATPPTCGQAGP